MIAGGSDDALGDARRKSHERLRLQKIEGRPFRWLDRVPLLDVPDGRGAILSNTYAVEVESEGFMEGCVHIYTPRNTTEFPGIVLAYGLEDYYKSAYYFSSGQFEGLCVPFTECVATLEASFATARELGLTVKSSAA